MGLVGTYLAWSLNSNGWTCGRMREVTSTLDSIACGFTVINNLLTTLALVSRSSTRSPLLLFVTPLAFIAWAAFQQLLSRWKPDWYYRHHGYLLLFNRLIRLPSLLLTIRETQRLAAASNLHDAVNKYQQSARPGTSEPLLLFTVTLAISGCLQLLMHSTAAPLPFFPQLLLQTTSYLVLLRGLLDPATRLLGSSPLQATASTVCVYLNDVLHLGSMMFGVYLQQQPLEDACSQHSFKLLLLLTQLFFGLVLPLFFSYRLQQYILQYLLQYTSQSTPAAGSRLARVVFFGLHCPPAAGLPVLCADALVLLYLLMVCWVAVVLLHPYASLIAWVPPAEA